MKTKKAAGTFDVARLVVFTGDHSEACKAMKEAGTFEGLARYLWCAG